MIELADCPVTAIERIAAEALEPVCRTLIHVALILSNKIVISFSGWPRVGREQLIRITRRKNSYISAEFRTFDAGHVRKQILIDPKAVLIDNALAGDKHEYLSRSKKLMDPAGRYKGFFFPIHSVDISSDVKIKNPDQLRAPVITSWVKVYDLRKARYLPATGT